MNGLFKYFPTDSYKLKKLSNQQLLLTPPKYFNDPWDFLVQREPATEAEIRCLFDQFERERTPGQMGPSFDEFKAAVTRPQFLEEEGPSMQAGLSNLLGVVSLTTDPLNRLMWAHYADSHRGIVIEFAHGPEKETQGFRVVVSPFGLAFKVVYEQKFSKIESDFSNAAEVYATKHELWRYEDEWRVIRPLLDATTEVVDRKTFHLLHFNPNHLIRVILGLRVDSKVQTQLSEMLSAQDFVHVKKDKVTIDAKSGQLTSTPF